MSLMHISAFYRASFRSALFQWIITAIRLRGQAELCAVLADPAAQSGAARHIRQD